MICNPLIFMVRLERFERPTYGFVVRCSIQLSYKRIKRWLYSALNGIYQLFFDGAIALKTLWPHYLYQNLQFSAFVT